MNTSALYEACRTGDIHTVQQLLSTLSIYEINHVEPNGSTCLHAAASSNHSQIVKLLLDSGVIRSILDKDGHTAMDVAATEEIKKLFPRSFAAAQARFLTDISSEQTFEWTCHENARYGWWFKCCIENEDVIVAVDRIIEDTRFSDTASTHKIEYLLENARETRDPKWLIQAYSSEIGLYQVINKAFAQTASNIGFDSTNDFRALAGVFSRHDVLKQYRYVGKCYRGMKLSIDDFQKNYKVGEILLIKPFMSTSKLRHIAEQFATSSSTVDSQFLSVLFIFAIPEFTLQFRDNVALDISCISEYPHEEEVLILPYTSLVIQAINHLPLGLIEVEFGWYSFLRDSKSSKTSLYEQPSLM
ncbi:unnamed protein product [Adineta steineri]|uniref:NAD(P)(+)--arginine ADP-ribosyltransferase n=1 Tax=Adineta steineri TaxID=433720 RepID=A0A815MVH1_9BILA|nr:unnamed protein product [Adineta steineri]CAF3796453.1 unnamed protein product [Adineta steineri]